MPKPLKSLLIVFSLLVFAGILALVWNQWPRPAGDKVAEGASSGSGQASQQAGAGSGQTATVDAQATDQTAGQTTDQTTGQTTGQSAETAATDPPASAGANGADAAKGDKVAALTPQNGDGSAESAAPQGEAAAAPGAATDAAPDAPAASGTPAAAAQPSFDIVRVEPSGDAVVAGRGAPEARVELLSNGSVIATTKADAAGEFVFVLEQPLAAGGHDLALRTSGGEGVSIYSKTNVAVAVPERPSGEVLVVMNEPGAASQILAKPDEAASASAGSVTVAEGETVIAVAPAAKAQMAESAPPATGEATGAPPPAAETADVATAGKPETTPEVTAEAAPPAAETADVATAGKPETTPEMTAEAAPAEPLVAAPAQQTAEAAPGTPAGQEQQTQAAEMAPAVPETRPQPQVAQVAPAATAEKPVEDTAGQKIAEAPQPAVEAAPPRPPVPLSVEAVEIEGDKLFAAGTAEQGTTVRVYADGKLIGETTAFDNDRWLVEALADVPAGTVTVRADQLAPGRASVVARAEVPFTRQLDTAVLVPKAAGGAPAGVSAQGNLANPNAVIIRRGDNLWTISRRTYGRGIRYTTIYTANQDQIRNPHMIFPGQVFMLPVGEKSWTQ